MKNAYTIKTTQFRAKSYQENKQLNKIKAGSSHVSNVENLCFSAAGYSVVLQLKKTIRYIVQEFCEACKEREENMSDVQGTFL